MARIHVVTPDRTSAATLPPGLSGSVAASTYVAPPGFPLRLEQVRLAGRETLTIGPGESEVIAYVWHGNADGGGHALAAGSSVIVEKGARLVLSGAGGGCELLVFQSGVPQPDATGGHVHILPNERVPRDSALNESGVSGGMHADAQCPTCSVWLHENGFAGSGPKSPEEQAVGVHSHSEDEIIVIVSGQIRLGNKLFPEGTAIAIPADTLYGFTPGPDGMRFINFRAGLPGEIHFASGVTMDETGYWREKLPRPDYLEPA